MSPLLPDWFFLVLLGCPGYTWDMVKAWLAAHGVH